MMLEKYQAHRVIIDSIRDRGLKRTTQVLFAFIIDILFDLKYGTDTFSWTDLRDLDIESENRLRGFDYVPTKASPFRKVLRESKVQTEGAFVDFGSGKGRLLFLASEYGFKKVIGIEFSSELCEVAESNVRILEKKFGNEIDLKILNIDAAEYEFCGDESVMYFFNPFDNIVMCKILENLGKSLEKNPRKIWIIYNNPVHREVIEKSGLFQRACDYRIGGNDFLVFSNGS